MISYQLGYYQGKLIKEISKTCILVIFLGKNCLIILVKMTEMSSDRVQSWSLQNSKQQPIPATKKMPWSIRTNQRANPHFTSSHWQQYNITLLESQSAKETQTRFDCFLFFSSEDLLNLSHFLTRVCAKQSHQARKNTSPSTSNHKRGRQFILKSILTLPQIALIKAP